MSARIDASGKVYQLDRRAEPDEVLTEEDVKDASKLSRLLMRVLKDVITLKRRHAPQRLDFEDIAVTATATPIRVPHSLNARVRWWIVDWAPTSTAANFVPLLSKASTSDLNTLVLTNIDVTGIGRFAGRVSVRVEVAD